MPPDFQQVLNASDPCVMCPIISPLWVIALVVLLLVVLMVVIVVVSIICSILRVALIRRGNGNLYLLRVC